MAFAEKIMGSKAGVRDRLSFAFRQALNREPSERELMILSNIFEKHKQDFSTDAASARESIKAGLRTPSADLDTKELAAWSSVARIILNLHETITRY